MSQATELNTPLVLRHAFDNCIPDDIRQAQASELLGLGMSGPRIQWNIRNALLKNTPDYEQVFGQWQTQRLENDEDSHVTAFHADEGVWKYRLRFDVDLEEIGFKPVRAKVPVVNDKGKTSYETRNGYVLDIREIPLGERTKSALKHGTASIGNAIFTGIITGIAPWPVVTASNYIKTADIGTLTEIAVGVAGLGATYLITKGALDGVKASINQGRIAARHLREDRIGFFIRPENDGPVIPANDFNKAVGKHIILKYKSSPENPTIAASVSAPAPAAPALAA